MKRLFDISIIKTFWAARFQTIFESLFRKSTPKAVENPTVFVQKKIPVTPNPVNPTPPKREMHSTVVKAAAFRKPMIKFIGARLPRPFYDAAALPPLQVSGNFAAAVAPSAPKTATSIGPVGKIPRGQGIDSAQLPLKFRRHGLSEEECDAINTGFFYQR